MVALFTRAWIEITICTYLFCDYNVALFTRAWIEIAVLLCMVIGSTGRPLHEGVD